MEVKVIPTKEFLEGALYVLRQSDNSTLEIDRVALDDYATFRLVLNAEDETVEILDHYNDTRFNVRIANYESSTWKKIKDRILEIQEEINSLYEEVDGLFQTEEEKDKQRSIEDLFEEE